jgi:5-methyltetrahydrofolate--homocysteine methyltransferase
MLLNQAGKMIKISRPENTGIKIFRDHSLGELVDHIDWTNFFHEWRLNGKFPAILDDAVKGKVAAKLFDDAQEMIKQLIDEKWLVANGVEGIFHANSVGDDIEIYSSEKKDKVLTTFHFLRNQQQQEGVPNYCLADFIAPLDSGITDYLGCFAVTAALGIEEKVEAFRKDNDDYSSLMLKILADRLAEAFAELLHLKVRKEIWGYDKEEDLSLEEIHLGRFRGIRPAPGYPACPDHSEKAQIFKLLDATKNTGITLTESFMMVPAASVCGWYFAHPEAKYFSVGKISPEQLEDYAKRKNTAVNEIRRFLSALIAD